MCHGCGPTGLARSRDQCGRCQLMKSSKSARGLSFSAKKMRCPVLCAGLPVFSGVLRARCVAYRRNTDCTTVAREFHVSPCEEDRDRMEIRFVSSLTPEDENLFAPALLKAVGALLDQLPIAYTVRIETTGSQVFQHTHTAPDPEPSRDTVENPARGLDGAIGFPAFQRFART